MITKQLKVLNELGIHARVAVRLTKLAGGFSSRIEAVKGDARHSLKNVLGIMMLETKCGDLVEVEFEGDDEEAAAQGVEKLFIEKFGEK